MSRNALHNLFAHPPRAGVIHVSQAQDADHALFAPLDYGKPANLLLLHEARCLVEVLAVDAEQWAFGHDLGGCGAGCIATSSDAAAHDVPISHHADQAII